ncbi:unnamed protein product [Sphagnum troendelagicum]|uniref:Uncharacterized protein n=1 Tax=Sphagnum troendelagicum TaxID=128251 RepID=A0ABP0UQM7_9BRYO
MCPLRVILLFLSALLAGYFAFKSVTSNSTKPGGGGVFDATDEVLQVGSADDRSLVEGGNQNACKKVSMRLRAGFWLLVDMLSGRYLWNNLKLQEKKPSAEAIMKAGRG